MYCNLMGMLWKVIKACVYISMCIGSNQVASLEQKYNFAKSIILISLS